MNWAALVGPIQLHREDPDVVQVANDDRPSALNSYADGPGAMRTAFCMHLGMRSDPIDGRKMVSKSSGNATKPVALGRGATWASQCPLSGAMLRA